MRAIANTTICFVILLFTVTLTVWGEPAFAKDLEKPDELRITHGPPEHVAAVKGDVLTLEVKYQGNPELYQQVKWTVKSKAMVCREKVCKLKTSGFQPGRYTIYVVVYDDNGSDSLRLQLSIKNPDTKNKPSIRTIPSIALSADRTSANLSRAKLQLFRGYEATTIEGKTFAHNRHKIQVIGNRSTRIDNASTLRTGGDGLMRVARLGENETWILSRSLVKIGANKSGSGTLDLIRGAIRMRSIDETAEKVTWDVASAGYVFRGDNRRDFIVKVIPGGEIIVANLRGSLKVHTALPSNGGADEQSFFRLAPGSIVRLKQRAKTTNGVPPPPENVDNAAEQSAVAEIIRKTSPQYLVKRLATDPRAFLTKLPPANWRSAVQKSQAAAKDGDAWLAIEPLLFEFQTAEKNPIGSYLLGSAYLSIHLLDEGETWLKKGLANIERSSRKGAYDGVEDEIHAALGRLYFRRKSWPESAMHFTALDRNAWLAKNTTNSNLSFEIGKACALGGSPEIARPLLIQASSSAPSNASRNEARSLLKKLPLLPGTHISGNVGVGYNSNVLGLEKPGDKDALPSSVKRNQTGTWTLGVDWTTRGSAADDLNQDDQSRYGLSASIKLNRDAFFEKTLLPYTFSQYFGQFGFFYTQAAPTPKGGKSPSGKTVSDAAPMFDLDLYGYFEIGGIGDQRIHDEGGAGMIVTVPWLLDSSLEFRTGRIVDPQITFLHPIEYLTRESGLGVDDSGKITRLKLLMIPSGPANFDGEPIGTSQLRFSVESVTASRGDYPKGSGKFTLTETEIAYGKKLLDAAVMTLLLGGSMETRSIDDTEAASLAVPTKRSRINFGIKYLHQFTNTVAMQIESAQSMVTQKPVESFASYSRAITKISLNWQI